MLRVAQCFLTRIVNPDDIRPHAAPSAELRNDQAHAESYFSRALPTQFQWAACGRISSGVTMLVRKALGGDLTANRFVAASVNLDKVGLK